MKNQKRTKQRRTTLQQRIRIVEQFEQSGLTRRAFSKQSGIPVSTLGKWLKDTRSITNHPSPVILKEVTLPEVKPDFLMPFAVELTGPTGIMVRCRESLSVEALALLLCGLPC
jgi:hypothetical protein